jgi:hypothetical protein
MFDCPGAAYLAGPARRRFELIFGARSCVPPPLQGPLILRLSHADADPARVKLETIVQNTLAEMGYPAPRVLATESDPAILDGPFMVMQRVPGKTLAHAIEGFGAARPLGQRVRLLFSLPAVLNGIIDQWLRCRSACSTAGGTCCTQ